MRKFMFNLCAILLLFWQNAEAQTFDFYNSPLNPVTGQVCQDCAGVDSNLGDGDFANSHSQFYKF